jgi:hypothetical protein
VRGPSPQRSELEAFVVKYGQEIGVPPVQIPEDNDEVFVEDLVLAVFVDKDRLSSGMFAIQKDNQYYLPVQQLGEVLGIYVDVTNDNKLVEGWTISEDRNYTIDVLGNSVSYKGNSAKLPPEAVLSQEFADDDLYVQLEVLNQIWPLTLNVDLSALILRVTPDEKLPYQLFLDRKKRQERLQQRNAEKVDDNIVYPFVAKPYALIDKPSVGIDASVGYNARSDSMQYRASLFGVQDLLYASADYSAILSQQGGDFTPPENIRLRFRRQNIHEGALPFGLEDTQWGDVNIRNRELISSSLSGRGFVFSTKRNDFQTEFDTVVIDGVAIPGYEVELYRNDQLIDFGVVDDTGVYRFEDVSIGFGNNRVRVVLYGPQGEIEERVENFFFRSNVVKKGDNVFIGGIIDSQRKLIPIDDDRRNTRAEGLAANLYAARGLTQKITGFFTANTLNDGVSEIETQRRNYLSTGVIASLGRTIGQVELYKQLSGGEAVDVKTASDFKGFKINTQSAFYRDFESPDARSGDNAKKIELDLNVRRNFGTAIGAVGLEVGADYLQRENGNETVNLVTRQSLGVRSTRLSHNTRTSILDGDHATTIGTLTSSTRRKKFTFRNRLSYDIHPEFDINTYTADLRYRKNKDFSGGVSLTRNFDNQETIAAVQLTRDFQKYRASFQTDWSSQAGFGFQLRASTALGPYNQDGSYYMTSDPISAAGPVGSFVYLDRDYDGEFSEGDEPVPDTRIAIGRRTTRDETDDNGYLTRISTSSGRVANVGVSSRSIDDPYLVAESPGYSVYPRPGVIHRLEFPLIETGAIDGTLFFTNGRPVAGLDLQLLDENGGVIAKSQTGADGYYTFERIAPGVYNVQADPESGFNIPATIVNLTPDELFQFGNDIEISGLDNAEPSEPIAAVSTDGALTAKNILSLVKGIKEKNTDDMMPTNAMPLDVMQGAVLMPQTRLPNSMEPLIPSNIAPAAGNITLNEGAFYDSQIMNELTPRAPMVKMPLDSASLNEASFGGLPLSSVDEMRVGIHPDKVRLVMDLSAPAEYEISYDEGAQLIYVDMPQTSWSAGEAWEKKVGSIINKYAVEALPTSGTRLILGVKQGIKLGQSGLLKASAGQKNRLFLDIVSN